MYSIELNLLLKIIELIKGNNIESIPELDIIMNSGLTQYIDFGYISKAKFELFNGNLKNAVENYKIFYESKKNGIIKSSDLIDFMDFLELYLELLILENKNVNDEFMNIYNEIKNNELIKSMDLLVWRFNILDSIISFIKNKNINIKERINEYIKNIEKENLWLLLLRYYTIIYLLTEDKDFENKLKNVLQITNLEGLRKSYQKILGDKAQNIVQKN